MKKGGLIIFLLCCSLFVLGSHAALCQYNYTLPPISYYYTNPLYYSNYKYINSIIEPFYYLGYGYKTPIQGNTLLGWNRYSPFHGAYAQYLHNYFDIPTYGYVTSPYATAFPYKTLPGAGYPYERFTYPAYTYGLGDYYQAWVDLQ